MHCRVYMCHLHLVENAGGAYILNYKLVCKNVSNKVISYSAEFMIELSGHQETQCLWCQPWLTGSCVEGREGEQTPPMFFMHAFSSPSASSLKREVRVMTRVTLLEFFSCLTALWKGQPIKAWINCSIMCVWVGACGFSHTLALSLFAWQSWIRISMERVGGVGSSKQ